eukprot:gene61746-84446_t
MLFAIYFVLGVATGLTMEFEFGMNWAYYSHYVGDIFGAPLAIEGLMAFFLEATFVGVMFFGWDKLSKQAHLFSTFMVALGSNLSALWILVANGWMQHPTGSAFNPATMRMERGAAGFGFAETAEYRAGTTPLEVFVAVCDRMGIDTGCDLFKLMDMAEDLIVPMMDQMVRIDRASLTLGFAGVYSTFLLHAKRLGAKYGLPAREMPNSVATFSAVSPIE